MLVKRLRPLRFLANVRTRACVLPSAAAYYIAASTPDPLPGKIGVIVLGHFSQIEGTATAARGLPTQVWPDLALAKPLLWTQRDTPVCSP